MELARKAVSAVGVGVFGLYMLSVMLMTPYLNYQYANTNGFVAWVMFGEVVSTLKATVWPFFVFGGKSEPLNHDELGKFNAAVPPLAQPELTDQDVAAARAALTGYEARTGQRLARSMFDEQLGWSSTYFEWRAELAASVVLSWDKQAVTKSGRYEQLSPALLRLGMGDQLTWGDALLKANAEHRASFTYDGDTLPLDTRLFLVMERQERRRLASFYDLVQRVLDLTR